MNLAGRLLLADDEGPFGAPTSDSERTAVTATTTRLLVVVFCPVERADGHLSMMLEHIADRSRATPPPAWWPCAWHNEPGAVGGGPPARSREA